MCRASVTKLSTTPAFLSWPSGLAVTICDNRAARRYRRKFKSGYTPIFLYIYIYIYEPAHEKKGVTYGCTVLRYGDLKSADQFGRSSPELRPC